VTPTTSQKNISSNTPSSQTQQKQQPQRTTSKGVNNDLSSQLGSLKVCLKWNVSCQLLYYIILISYIILHLYHILYYTPSSQTRQPQRTTSKGVNNDLSSQLDSLKVCIKWNVSCQLYYIILLYYTIILYLYHILFFFLQDFVFVNIKDALRFVVNSHFLCINSNTKLVNSRKASLIEKTKSDR
jgi:hypothetical protein